MRTLLALVGLFALLCPSAVLAQVSPSVGIPVPDGSVATQSDSASLEVNPAGIGYVEGSEISYGFFLPTSDFRGTIPGGHSLALAAGGPRTGVGFGVQWMDNPLLGGYRSAFRKYTLGAALSSRFFSFGGSLNYFGSRYDERLNALRTVDLGVQWRPGPLLGVGLMARDVTPAFLDDEQALPPRVGIGMALRFFQGRLVLDTEVHSVRRADHFELRPRLAAEPLSGVRLFSSGLVTIPSPGSTGTPDWDGFNVGLELSLGSIGIQTAANIRDDIGSGGVKAGGVAYRAWASSQPQKRSLFPSGVGESWVRLRVEGNISEQASTPFFGESSASFLNLINDVYAIVEDPSVDGVLLDLRTVRIGLSQIWELHQAFDALRDAGKQSAALLRNPTTRAIYAASVADQIWISPVTPYAPTAAMAEFVSFAGLLDRYGLEAEFIRVGDYKSAPEAYIQPGPSDEALEQTGEILDAFNAEVLSRVAARRGLEVEDLEALVSRSPIFPAEALELGLVDAVVYSDELEELLRERLGARVHLQRDYRRYEIADERWGARPEIAVVYVDGMIIDGDSGGSPFGGSPVAGAESLTRTLRALRTDPSVRAVVIRIDSPGGSALGSDFIYRELRHLAQAKPVVASMSNVAASGGYYVAAGADEIFATPLTVTGSIGIFAGKFNIATLAERLGINTERLVQGEGPGNPSIWEPWTDEERQALGRAIEYLYNLFLQQIERTRPLTVEEIDAVARGRVWTGAAAQEAQLIDQVGGFTDALRRAEELAGLEAGQAVYVDRTGAGGLQMSPGMASHLSTALDRLGLGPDRPVAAPDGAIPRALREMETALLWPLYFDSGDVVALPPYLFTLH